MEITHNQKNLLQNALGSSDPSKWRTNQFISAVKHYSYNDLCKLENKGLVRRVPSMLYHTGRFIIFEVTDAGREMAK